MVKIYFKGYSERIDERRSWHEKNSPVARLEPMSQPSDDTLSDRLRVFFERAYKEIKRKWYSGRREDPKLRIEITSKFSLKALDGLRPKDITEE